MSLIRDLIIFLLLPALTAAAAPPAAAQTAALLSPAEACNSTSHPDLCQAILLQVKAPSNRFDFSRCSIEQALQQANHTAAILYGYAVATGGNPGRRADDNVPRSAPEICHSMAGLSADYLASVNRELEHGEAALDAMAAARLRSLMNAVVTNQHTCADALQEEMGTAVPVQLLNELAYGTRVYSTSLEMIIAALNWTSDSRDCFGGNRDDMPVKKKLTVSKDGRGHFTKIQDAVDAAAGDPSVNNNFNDGYILINISEGIYEENIIVSRSKNVKLMFVGAGINKTVLTSSRSFADGYKTYDTGAFAVDGMEEVIVQNITFQNTAGPRKGQAAAMRASGDLAVFYQCSFVGYQDTLYAHSGRQFYRECDIYGTIDFVCGNAIAVLQNCNIYTRRPMRGQFNVVTAQARTKDTPDTGFSIHNCTIKAAPEVRGARTRTYLGRPWEEYSRTVVMQTYIAGIVVRTGWAQWHGLRGLATLYYGEYGNHGPGAGTRGRVRWPGYKAMDAKAASMFTVKSFLKATPWLAAVSIPNDPNLINN